MTTRENKKSKLSDSDFDPRMSPYLPYVPKPMQFPIPPYTPPPLLPVRPLMPLVDSSPYFLNMNLYPNYSKQSSSESED